MGDYVSDITPHAKFKMITPLGASWHMGEISLSRGFYFFVTCNLAHARRQNHTTSFTLFDA